MPTPKPPFERLLSKYKKDPVTGCWIWQGPKYRNGYGWLKVFGRVMSAHRYSYELHKGPIPNEMEVLHSCDVKHCINPEHLRIGSHAENMREARDRGLMPSGKKHHMFGKRNPRPNQANKVLVLGKEYPSQREAERHLGLGQGTVAYWIKNKPHKAKIIKRGNEHG